MKGEITVSLVNLAKLALCDVSCHNFSCHVPSCLFDKVQSELIYREHSALWAQLFDSVPEFSHLQVTLTRTICWVQASKAEHRGHHPYL